MAGPGAVLVRHGPAAAGLAPIRPHYRLSLLRRQRRRKQASARAREISRLRPAAAGLYAWLRGGDERRRFLRAERAGCGNTRPARRAADRGRRSQPAQTRFTKEHLRRAIRALFADL